MLEALKARYFVYRQLLKFQLWMSRLSGGAQWAVIIGLYVGFRVIREVGRSNPSLLPITMPIVILYSLFALITWIGDPVFNSLLRLNRFGRLALAPHERAASSAFIALVVAAAACGVASIWVLKGLLFFAAIYFLLLIIPLTHTFGRPDPEQRRRLWWIAGTLIALGPAALAALLYSTGTATTLFLVFAAGCVLFQWLAIAVALRRDYR
jgi:hypothetical protein